MNVSIGGGRLLVTSEGLQFRTTTRALPLDPYLTYVSRAEATISQKRGLLRHGLRIEDSSNFVIFFWTYRPKPIIEVLSNYGYTIRP